jgi:hypothetical protein
MCATEMMCGSFKTEMFGSSSLAKIERGLPSSSSFRVLLLIFLTILSVISSTCPNLCHGHGECNAETGSCECEDDYALAADCSLCKITDQELSIYFSFLSQ